MGPRRPSRHQEVEIDERGIGVRRGLSQPKEPPSCFSEKISCFRDSSCDKKEQETDEIEMMNIIFESMFHRQSMKDQCDKDHFFSTEKCGLSFNASFKFYNNRQMLSLLVEFSCQPNYPSFADHCMNVIMPRARYNPTDSKSRERNLLLPLPVPRSDTSPVVVIHFLTLNYVKYKLRGGAKLPI